VTADDMQKGFEANYGERVEVLAIVLSSQRRAQEVWEMARNNPTEDFFGELASQYSVEPVSNANRGRVPPIRKHGGNETLEKEAFGLQPGELSGLIATGDKYIILRCLGRTDPVVNDASSVENELYKELYERKLRIEMANEFDRLKEAAKVQTFLAGMVTRGRLAETE
jgi:parvulin-like peptidyl-prolyl isomerase